MVLTIIQAATVPMFCGSTVTAAVAAGYCKGFYDLASLRQAPASSNPYHNAYISLRDPCFENTLKLHPETLTPRLRAWLQMLLTEDCALGFC